MRIQNNIASINSSRNQGITKGKLNKTLEKLSSGYRINRAGDDAAGLAISAGILKAERPAAEIARIRECLQGFSGGNV